jgi:UDP-N-acetyl-2-amino-2-deoxyglucuronate dehydrogenase|tara:strand:+ start:477 stop:1472 length:996 start_codon:yes stop_codon:yes gene_type:complete
MSEENVRLGVIGLGGWGKMLANASTRAGNVDLVRCFARTKETRDSFSQEFDCKPAESYSEILNDDEVDGVILTTPHSTHVGMICEAASAGKHVFVEKPLTLTVEDANKSIDATSAAGVILQVGHHRRKQGANRRIKSMIEEGKLGEIHQLDANLSNVGGQNVRAGWRNDPEECPAGGMTGLGVHMIDNLIYLAGTVKRVSAFSKKLYGKTNLDDVTSFILEFDSGPLGFINTTYVVPKICLTAAYGTEGSAWSEEEGAKLFLQGKEETTRKEIPVEEGDALAEQIKEFSDCIKHGSKPEVSGTEGRDVIAVLQAVVESANTGKVLDIKEFM